MLRGQCRAPTRCGAAPVWFSRHSMRRVRMRRSSASLCRPSRFLKLQETLHRSDPRTRPVRSMAPMPLEPCPERAHAVRSECWRRCHGDFAFGAGDSRCGRGSSDGIVIGPFGCVLGLPAVAFWGFPRDNNRHSKPSADLGISRTCFPPEFFQNLQGFSSFFWGSDPVCL
jgi:hypothetical protein